ncbi:VWA domain-containing protein [Candidatus Babeliales bacterium]|nr:VWA domain-containing protein [Candidatus Babeliales bacterium]
MFLRFAYYQIFYFLVPIFLLAILYRLKFYKTPIYKFPLTSILSKSKFSKSSFHKKVLFVLRSSFLFGLIFLIARPQWVDSNSILNVDGVDIVLALDVSGSMELFDDLQDRRSRIEVAKSEAIKFIDKRTNDPIGIVLFGGDVISRCPLTLDKHILKNIVNELHIGFLNPNATLLGKGLATAVNRLRNSRAKSKIVILLTDGIPSPDSISFEVAIELAKKFGIKVYTIGVGGKAGGYGMDPLGRVLQAGASLDMRILEKIANETGGKAFRANNPGEMRNIYNTIDKLEKTNLETNIFHNYHEAYENFFWLMLFIFALEIFLILFKWRGII